jgi:hypothetical protein
VGGSHEYFPPRTTTLCLASNYLFTRVVSASDYSFARVISVSDQGGAHTRRLECGIGGPTRTWRCPDARTSPQRHARLRFSTSCKHPNWRDAWAVVSDRSCNAALLNCAASNAPSRPTSAARHPHQNRHLITLYKRHPPTLRSKRGGPNQHSKELSYLRKNSEKASSTPNIRCHTRQMPAPLQLNTLQQTSTWEKTSQHCIIVAHICIPFCPSPLRL